jgi:hypothetical protein
MVISSNLTIPVRHRAASGPYDPSRMMEMFLHIELNPGSGKT